MANKSDTIEQELRRKIHSRDWKPGMRIPSEAELCEEFKVSRTTVRAALSNLRSERLLLSRPKIGTLVSSIAGRPTIVILARQEDVMAPYGHWYRELANRVSCALRDEGFNPMLVMGFGETSPETVETIETYYAAAVRAAAGVVVVSAVTRELETYLNAPGMPPWSGISYGTRPIAGTVFADYRVLLERVQGMFARHGIQDYATIFISLTGLPEEDQSEWREELMREMLTREQRRRVDDYLVSVPYSPQFDQVRSTFMQWWGRPRRPKAVFFSDDALFDAFSHLPAQENIRIPQDLAVVTQANVGREFFFPLQPARIGQDPARVTAQLLELLHFRMRDPARRDLTCVSDWVDESGSTLAAAPRAAKSPECN